jgi:hypothetical protein
MEAAFDAYFRAADLDRDGRISGQEAVAFFKGSSLPQPVLAQVRLGSPRTWSPTPPLPFLFQPWDGSCKLGSHSEGSRFGDPASFHFAQPQLPFTRFLVLVLGSSFVFRYSSS